jgi:hypothetical protein
MTDKELLELAAKAAGIELQRSRLEDPLHLDFLLKKRDTDDNAVGWNPLTVDGDALRLAVKCRLEIDIEVTRILVKIPDGTKIEVDAEEVEDGYAATRRCIVRAAAEIGKQKE